MYFALRPLCALIVLACCADTQAQVVIASQHRVANTPRACCTYATLQTVASHQGYAGKVAGLMHRYDVQPSRNGVHPCHVGMGAMSQQLARLGIPHQASYHGTNDRSLLRQGLATGQPVIVYTRPEPGRKLGHIWAYVGERNGRVYLYDSNRTERPYVSKPAGQFYRAYDGGAILIPRR